MFHITFLILGSKLVKKFVVQCKFPKLENCQVALFPFTFTFVYGL